MTPEFSKCKICGIIFLNPDGMHEVCPKCRNEPELPESPREILRVLKNTIRDAQADGEFLTVPQVAEQTGIATDKVWHYIRSGEIDTASFDDPEVHDYLVRKKREQDKLARQRQLADRPESASTKEKYRGFHLRADDDKKQ